MSKVVSIKRTSLPSSASVGPVHAWDEIPAAEPAKPVASFEQRIEELRASAAPNGLLSDPAIPGFKVRKQTSKKGARLTFNFMARNPAGDSINVLLGQVGVVTLAEARARAQDMRRQIAQGVCPAQENEALKLGQKAKIKAGDEAKAMTIRAAVQLKLDDKRLRASSKKNYTSLINRSLKDWADKRLDRISKLDWHERLTKIETEISSTQAALVKRLVAALYRVAVAKSDHLQLDNPIAKLDRKEFADMGTRRQGTLAGENMRAWYCGLNNYHRTVQNLALFTVMTGMREAEARLMTWPEVSTGELIIPASRIKTKRELKLPITAAMAMILESQGWSNKRQSKGYVFPAIGSKNSPRPISSILPQLKSLDTTIHDLRRTAATMLDNISCPENVRRHILNHSPDISRGYIIKDMDVMRQWLTKYQDQLRGLMAEQSIEEFVAANPGALDEVEPEPAAKPEQWPGMR